MTDFKLLAYEKENGEVPIEEFLNTLDPKMRAKLFVLMEFFTGKSKYAEGTLQ